MVDSPRRCPFCDRHPMRAPCQLAYEGAPGQPSQRVVAYPCYDHYLILLKAGTRGRRYVGTGIRWWWLEDLPAPLGDASAPAWRD